MIERLSARIEGALTRAGRGRRQFIVFGLTQEEEGARLEELRRDQGATDDERLIVQWIRSDGNG